MYSMWEAPSDRDYYDQFNCAPEEEEEPDYADPVCTCPQSGSHPFACEAHGITLQNWGASDLDNGDHERDLGTHGVIPKLQPVRVRTARLTAPEFQMSKEVA